MKPMNKKPYKAPVVKKVRLEMSTAVLSVCHSSLVGDDMTVPPGCRVNEQCMMGAPVTNP
jgi:hypothetical protein